MRRADCKRGPGVAGVAVLALLALLPGCQTRSGNDEPARQAPATETVVTRAPAEPPRAPVPGQGVAYTLRFPAPHTHYVEVEAVLPVVGMAGAAPAESMEIFLPVWTPGSYLVREYSRHLEALTASTPAGAPLAIEKVRKNRWRVALGGATDGPAARPAHVVLRYRVYARELSVRTSFVDADIAVLAGASVFVTAAGGEGLPHEVALVPAEGWAASVTGLAPHPDGAAHHYLASDHDALVDAPIALGNPVVHEVEVEGVRHRVAAFLADPRWDHARAARDVETLVRAQLRFWGSLPYRDYVFLWMLGSSSSGGGLEHRNSTLMVGSSPKTAKEYADWLGLTSHELFHAWNVKALAPAEFARFDYENEVYTRSLWVVEGLTAYYDELLVRRAGLVGDEGYLAELSRRIEAVQTAPGRKVQSLALSSYDAWIEYYRPDENTANTSINYYHKGAVVGLLLDAEIRRLTADRRSLDDVMRLAYERYAGGRGYTPEQFRALASEVAGADLQGFFARTVDGTGELDFAPALAHFGLRFAEPAGGEPAAKDVNGTPGWLGVITRLEEGRLVVTEVRRETPAHAAGINVGDEILAIGEQRVPAAGLDELLRYFAPGSEVAILVARRGRLLRVPVVLGEAPVVDWSLELDPDASRQQRAQRARWLAGT
jgi:predicted metalloprotease with PDZ domain